MKNRKKRGGRGKYLILLLLLIGIITGGKSGNATHQSAAVTSEQEVSSVTGASWESQAGDAMVSAAAETSSADTIASPEASTVDAAAPAESETAETSPENTAYESLTPGSFPAYSGAPAVTVNGGAPFFTAADFTFGEGTSFSALDSLGRCGRALGVLSPGTLPTEPRGSIGMVRPAGFHTVKYAGIDGNYLYNRCHLIAYELSGVNAEPRNLTTGTRYLNIEGMLPYENRTVNFIKNTGKTVWYRSTPIYDGNNLLCSGILMEAASAEDGGKSFAFCVYCYNVQPGITINYADGASSGPPFEGSGNDAEETQNAAVPGTSSVRALPASGNGGDAQDYVLNTNTRKFHLPSCSSVSDIKPKNRKDVHESRGQIIADGYKPCKRCNP